MGYERVNAIRNVQIQSTGWTDIAGTAILPGPCNKVIVLNTSNQNVVYCSDPGNPNSQITLAPGQELSIGSTLFPPREGWRFPFGCSAAGSLQSASGAAVVIVITEI